MTAMGTETTVVLMPVLVKLAQNREFRTLKITTTLRIRLVITVTALLDVTSLCVLSPFPIASRQLLSPLLIDAACLSVHLLSLSNACEWILLPLGPMLVKKIPSIL